LKQQNEQLRANLEHLQNQQSNLENKTLTYSQESSKKWEDIQKLIQDKVKVNRSSTITNETDQFTTPQSKLISQSRSLEAAAIAEPESFMHQQQRHERPTMHYQFEKNKQQICVICHQCVDAVTIHGECQICLKQKLFFQSQKEIKPTKKSNKYDKRKYLQAERSGYEKALKEIEKYEKMDPGSES
jgi:hypothetical protein